MSGIRPGEARIDAVTGPIIGTVLFGIVLLIGAAVAVRWSDATVSRVTIGAGVVVIAWGQVFLAFGLIAGWRLLFAPTAGIPQKVSGTAIADYAELVKALAAAPNWLSLTAVGSAQTVVGVLLLHLGRHTDSTSEKTSDADSQPLSK